MINNFAANYELKRDIGIMGWAHRYRPEIPEPMPSIYWHGTPFEVI